MLKKFELTSCSAMNTPMTPPLTLDKDANGKSVNVTLYRGTVGSLLYLTASRPEIMYSTCLCARYQDDPKEVTSDRCKTNLQVPEGYTELGSLVS